MRNIKILASALDTFNLPRWCDAVSSVGNAHLLATWSPRRGVSCKAPHTNIVFLHYSLQAYKMIEALQYRNAAYFYLTRAMDLCARKFAASYKPDLYLGLSGTCLHTLEWCRARNIPTIVECGSTHPSFQSRILNEEYERCGVKHPLFPKRYLDVVHEEFEVADFIQLPSRFSAQTFVDAGVDQRKIRIVGRGADPALFRPQTSVAAQRPFRFVCPSGVNIRKGCRVLLEAWRRLDFSDAELHWVGDWKQICGVNNPLMRGITFHPWMGPRKLAELYRNCDVMVLSSFEEGLARVILEAGLSGLSVIATPNTGVQDVLNSEIPEGWIVPAGDIDALCQAMREAEANRQQCLEKGRLLTQRIQKHFTWEHYAARVQDWVRDIC